MMQIDNDGKIEVAHTPLGHERMGELVSFPIELEHTHTQIFFFEAFRHSGKAEGRLHVECLACVAFYVRCGYARHIVLGAPLILLHVQQQAQGNYTNHTACRAVFSFSVPTKTDARTVMATAAPE